MSFQEFARIFYWLAKARKSFVLFCFGLVWFGLVCCWWWFGFVSIFFFPREHGNNLLCSFSLNPEVIYHSHCYVSREEANTETVIYSTNGIKNECSPQQ